MFRVQVGGDCSEKFIRAWETISRCSSFSANLIVQENHEFFQDQLHLCCQPHHFNRYARTFLSALFIMKRYIPSYHLSMPRAFHRWDGHQYKRGLKICATTWQKLRRRDYKPELLGVKKDEIRTVRNFTQYEFANFVTYYRLMGILHNFPRDELEYYYMLTQGNGWQARRILTTLY